MLNLNNVRKNLRGEIIGTMECGIMICEPSIHQRICVKILEANHAVNSLRKFRSEVFANLNWDWEVHYERLAANGHFERLHTELVSLIAKAKVAADLIHLDVKFEDWNTVSLKHLNERYSAELASAYC